MPLTNYDEEDEIKSASSEQEYSLQLALEFIIILQKDVKVFMELPPAEQKKLFWQYQEEMKLLSDEEMCERYKKYMPNGNYLYKAYMEITHDQP